MTPWKTFIIMAVVFIVLPAMAFLPASKKNTNKIGDADGKVSIATINSAVSRCSFFYTGRGKSGVAKDFTNNYTTIPIADINVIFKQISTRNSPEPANNVKAERLPDLWYNPEYCNGVALTKLIVAYYTC